MGYCVDPQSIWLREMEKNDILALEKEIATVERIEKLSVYTILRQSIVTHMLRTQDVKG